MRLAVCALSLAAAAPLVAQQPTPPDGIDKDLQRKYANVAEWIGFWNASETSTETYRSSLNGSIWSNWCDDAQTSSRFHLRRATGGDWNPKDGLLEWNGTGVERWVSSETSAASESWSAHDLRTVGAGSVRSEAIWFRIMLRSGMAAFGSGASVSWPTAHTIGWTRNKDERQAVDIEHRLLRTTPLLYKGEQHSGSWEFRSAPGVLTFDDGRNHGKHDGDRDYRYDYRGQVVLCPVYDDLECEVTIADYASWLPMGSIDDPTKAGNALVAHAVLKSKKGKAADIPAVERFRFELIGTSCEPGVCMNWPLGAKGDGFDLRLADFATGAGGVDPKLVDQFLRAWAFTSQGDFDAASRPANVPAFMFPAVSDSGQKGELVGPPKDKDGQPFADAAIECFDFGAISELRVVCELKDGREIVGLMKGPDGEQDLVRLPRRAAGDWVAAKWRSDSKAGELPGSDDDESVDGQPRNGDGFTLYEEYRGFVVRGKHITGDPQAKDFFVLNLIGADAVPGIELFTAVSNLRVHSRLRTTEMSQSERLMNGNVGKGPHRVPQHGVWVKAFTDDSPGTENGRTGKQKLGDSGAMTAMLKAGVPGRPGITKGVGILARDDPASVFNQSFNLPPRDTIFAFDRAIAHELLHSVGVEHHGPTDSEIGLTWISPRNPSNKLGRPHFATLITRSAVTLLDENDHDIATQLMTQWAAQRQIMEQAFGEATAQRAKKFADFHDDNGKQIYKSERDYYEYLIEEQIGQSIGMVFGMLGEVGGAHSGNCDCLMRYCFANYYRKHESPTTYYRVTPGTDRIGFELCRSAAGTRFNEPKPPGLPQSRFGAAKRGNCFPQICPNDAIPPETSQ